MQESDTPQLPNLPPQNGNGGGEPPPPFVNINQISPIAAALVGGIDITISGSGFQPELG